MTVFLRLLGEEDKNTTLRGIVAAVNDGRTDPRVYTPNPKSFEKVPGTPFAYWVSENIRELFQKFPPFESDERSVRVGLQTSDDFRFVRLWWEVTQALSPRERAARSAGEGPPGGPHLPLTRHLLPEGEEGENRKWFPFAKGGAYSPFYADVHLNVRGEGFRQQVAYVNQRYPYLKGNAHRLVHAEIGLYFRPGLTWPRRTTSGFGLRALPAASVFADKGPAVFVSGDCQADLLAVLAVSASSPFQALVQLQMAAAEAAARSYEVGIIQNVPLPRPSRLDQDRLATLALRAWTLKRDIDTASLTSHVFTLPALLQAPVPPLPAGEAGRRPGEGPLGLPQLLPGSLREAIASWTSRLTETERLLSDIQREIDEIAFRLYGISDEDRKAMELSLSPGSTGEPAEGDEPQEPDEDDAADAPEASALVADFLDWCVGAAFGRFYLPRFPNAPAREGTLPLEALLSPEFPGPFDPLLPASPAMGGLGAPPPARAVLRDDPGLEGQAPHPLDLVKNVTDVLEYLWGSRSAEIEHEACEILGTPSLRDYFRKPGAFFERHLKRHSKSKRQAPLYWPLSTSGGEFTLWIYAPLLSQDLLYGLVNQHIDPKRDETEKHIAALDEKLTRATGRDAANLRTKREAAKTLLKGLNDMREELLRVAALPYRPDPDDGTLISAAPLSKLFLHSKWRKSLEACWKALEGGKYDWSKMAMAIWPDRVRKACEKDRSLAIAHGVEGSP